MNSRILFVFEGARSEEIISKNLTRHFFANNEVITCAYCNNIYSLYKEIIDDLDLDTFVLLSELPQNARTLSGYKRSDFSEIYFFFDYDGHDSLADDDVIIEMLDVFYEETERGKLMLSYPMVEAIKHFPFGEDFEFLKVKAKENIHYKNVVETESVHTYKQIAHYTWEDWKFILEMHLLKANKIVGGRFEFPMEELSQIRIFKAQLNQFILVDDSVAVLSAFPLFIYDYYGIGVVQRWVYS